MIFNVMCARIIGHHPGIRFHVHFHVYFQWQIIQPMNNSKSSAENICPSTNTTSPPAFKAFQNVFIATRNIQSHIVVFTSTPSYIHSTNLNNTESYGAHFAPTNCPTIAPKSAADATVPCSWWILPDAKKERKGKYDTIFRTIRRRCLGAVRKASQRNLWLCGDGHGQSSVTYSR